MPKQRIEGFGAVGWITDLSAASVPDGAWTTCEHVIPRDGKATRAWDSEKLFDIAIEPRLSFSFRDANDLQWVIVADGSRVWAYNVATGTGEEITPTSTPAGPIVTPINTDRISFCSHNGVLCYSTYMHGIFYWPGSGQRLEAFPEVQVDDGQGGTVNAGWRYDLGWRCRALASYKYYLVALGMNEGQEFPHKIRWSSSAEEGQVPTTWLPQLSNDAGNDLLGETSGAIIGAQLVQDALWIIKTDSVYTLNWVGGLSVLQTRRLRGVLDIASRHAAQEYLGSLVVLSGKDLYRYDGAALSSLTQNKVRDALTKSVSVGGFDRCKLFVDQFVQNLFVFGRSIDQHRHGEALVFDLVNGVWGHMFLNNAYQMLNVNIRDAVGTFTPEILVLESNPQATSWWVSKLTRSAQAQAIHTSRVGRKGKPVNGAPGSAMITQVWPEITGTAQIALTMLGQDVLDGSVFSDGPYSFDSRSTAHVEPRITARFLGYEMTCSTPGPWEVDNLTYNWEPAGEH